MNDPNRSRYLTRSVERALAILHLFILGEAEISLSEISQRVGLHQSTVFRLLATLSSAGFTEHDPQTGRYRLGPEALALGQAYLRHSDLRHIAEAPLAALRDRSSETVHLATLQGAQVIYLEKLPGLHPIGLMSSRIGDRSPAHCTGLGKALLAYVPEAEVRRTFSSGLQSFTPRTITRIAGLLEELDRIRNQGYAVDNEEHELGVVCVAAPVFDTDRVVAAISASGPADRIRKEMREQRLTQAVLTAAGEISARLGRVTAPVPQTPKANAQKSPAGGSRR